MNHLETEHKSDAKATRYIKANLLTFQFPTAYL